MIPTASRTYIGLKAGPHLRRVLAPASLLALVALALAIVIPGGGAVTACASPADPTLAPDLRVTALPGVDLRPVLGLPGIAAASGPFPGTATSLRHDGAEIGTWLEARGSRPSVVDRPALVAGRWLRPGGMVVEAGLARALRLRPGDRAVVSTTSGPLRLRVAGIARTSSRTRSASAPGLAYVTSRDLGRVAPAAVQGSTVLVRTAQSGQAGLLARWLARRYPGPQAHTERLAADRCGTTR